MNRNLRVLGLTITAVIAMNAFWAMSAQAADPEIHCTSTTNTCTVTATEINTHTFTVEGGNVRCRSRLTATLNAKTVSSVTRIAASYNECRAFGVAATVAMNECTYTLNNVAASSPATANVDIVCPEGKTISVNAPSLPCTVNVGGQTGLDHTLIENTTTRNTEPTHSVMRITTLNTKYTKVQNTCPRGAGTLNTGTYNGESMLEGFNDNAPSTEGNKVGLHVKPL